eukprot:6592057-Pyramimonas_sp.AAC.1
MLDAHGLCILNTFWHAGPTYFRERGQATRPDYIAATQGLRAHILSCKVWCRAAKAFQMINDSVPRDHEPLVTAADISKTNIFTDKQRTAWDYDKMAQSLQTGMRRCEFIEAPGANLMANKDALQDLAAANTTDDHW